MMKATDMMYKQLISLDGIEGTINGKTVKFLATENEITTDEPLLEGSFIVINGNSYLVTEIKNKINHGLYNIGVFEKTLPILLGSNYKPVNAVIKKYRGEYVDGQYLNEVHDQYIFKISKNDTDMNTLSIGNDLIIYDKGLYNILSTDNTNDGILIITGKFDTVYVPHTYSVSLSETTKIIVEGETYQIVATCKDNGTVVTNPQLTYLSSDVNIANVSDSGLITGIKVGTCNISVNYNNNITILTLTVNAKAVEKVVSYSFTASNGYSYRVKEGSTISYVKMINSVVDATLNVSYTLDSIGQQLLNSSAISITKPTNSSIQIRNLTITTAKSFVLTVTDSSNGTVIATQTISTRSA